MLTYLMRRATMAAVVMVIVSVICFVLSNVASDPAVGIAGAQATDADLAVVRQTYGLDRPLPVRYAEYIGNLLQGDFGTSYLAKRPVLEMILERLPVTALLAFLSMALALAIALPLGCAAALWPNTLIDRLSQVLAVTGQAFPISGPACCSSSCSACSCAGCPFPVPTRWRISCCRRSPLAPSPCRR